MYEALKLIVTTLVLPPGGPMVLTVLGVFALRRHPLAGRALMLLGVSALWLCSLPIVAGALVTALGGSRPVALSSARQADAIVILGGGVRPRAIEYGGDTLGRLTLERVRYGAYLARETGLPILVTGGAPKPNIRAEADLMREALEQEYGIRVRWLENRARNTSENARFSAQLLTAEGKRKVLLVMHGFDVRRSARNFALAGLEAIPAPIQVASLGELEVADFLPNVAALHVCHFALYEALALLREAVARAIFAAERL